MSQSPKTIYSNHPAVSNGIVESLKSEDIFNAELASEMVKRTDKLTDQNIDLALRLKQAREFMAWSVNHIRGQWLDWQDESSKACVQMSQLRMTFDRETKSLVAAGKDLRDFFNSEDYLKAHATLKESINLLEKFSALKANGTLDALADFILKVSCK